MRKIFKKISLIIVCLIGIFFVYSITGIVIEKREQNIINQYEIETKGEIPNVFITKEFYNKIVSETNKYSPKETIGCINLKRINYGYLAEEMITIPIKRTEEETTGKCLFLKDGMWHSHTNGNCSPSPYDVKNSRLFDLLVCNNTVKVYDKGGRIWNIRIIEDV